MDKQKIKLIVAVVILVLAVVLIVWNMGVFSGGGAAEAPPPEAVPEAPRGGARTAP